MCVGYPRTMRHILIALFVLMAIYALCDGASGLKNTDPHEEVAMEDKLVEKRASKYKLDYFKIIFYLNFSVVKKFEGCVLVKIH